MEIYRYFCCIPARNAVKGEKYEANCFCDDGRVAAIAYVGNTGRHHSPLEACDGLVQACETKR